MRTFVCEHLHQPGGWLSPGVVTVNERGMITEVRGGWPSEEKLRGAREWGEVIELDGFVIPGFANVHSHAFQRALAGWAEYSARRDDSFWTWREAMYRLALAITPDQLEGIAAQLYVEMLEAGMTAVGEFHYLHHAPDGAPYADRGELSRRIIRAAERAGIGLTLLPVLYARGGFDAAPRPEQRRFVHAGTDELFATIDAVRLPDSEARLFRLGLAPHSLRAVTRELLVEAVDELRRRDPYAPVHIHIAEQTAEVEQCVAALGARPVAWLADTVALDDRWCLVHATHIDADEVAALAGSGAIAGLCPTTEANLGDGVFPAEPYVRVGGRFAIGSDSHVAVDPAEELRALEYSQRLTTRRRNVLCDRDGGADASVDAHVGRYLFDRAVTGGADAIAQPIGAIAPGHRADLVVLDPMHPRLAGHGPRTALDVWMFSGSGGGARVVEHVYVAGEARVRDGRHVARDSVETAFRYAMGTLLRRA